MTEKHRLEKGKFQVLGASVVCAEMVCNEGRTREPVGAERDLVLRVPHAGTPAAASVLRAHSLWWMGHPEAQARGTEAYGPDRAHHVRHS